MLALRHVALDVAALGENIHRTRSAVYSNLSHIGGLDIML